MALKEENGRIKSHRSPAEIGEVLKKELDRLNPAERQALLLCLKELDDPAMRSVEDAALGGGPTRIFDALSEGEYKTRPVDMETFVKDPYYLGETCSDLYPKLLVDLREIFEGGYKEVIVTGAIGIGKTYLASIAVCRMLYEFSCLRDPHRSFGMAPDSNISIVVFSVNEVLAIKVAFENIATKLRASQYFQDNFQYQDTKKELRFPHNIWVAARASTDTSALGLNVFGAVMDECLAGNSLVLLADGTEKSAKELFDNNTNINIATFDFSLNKYVSAQAFIKKSSDQECFNLSLDNGYTLKASWNHPIAIRDFTGKLCFKLMKDVSEGDEVLIYGQKRRKIKRRTKKVIIRGSKKKSRRKESILRKETLRRNQGKNVATQKTHWLDAFRGNQRKNQIEKCRESSIRINQIENVGASQTTMERRTINAAATHVGHRQFSVWEENVTACQVRNYSSQYGTNSIDRSASQNVSIPIGSSYAYREIQTGFNPTKQNPNFQAFRGNKTENFREQYLAYQAKRFQIPWLFRNKEGGVNWIQKFMGAEGIRNIRRRQSSNILRIRAFFSALCTRRETSLDYSRLQSVSCRRFSESDRSKTSYLHWQQERKSQDDRRNAVLQGAKLGIRGLGRVLSVVRVVSKKNMGTQPTYDISVPGKEVFIADGVLVHNTNFFNSTKDINYTNKDRASAIYDQLIRRMKSRFQRHGKLPGLMFVVSSKRTKEDFTAKRILEAKDDPDVYVIDYAKWDVAPEIYSKKKFQVLVGNEMVPSRILIPEEVSAIRAKLTDNLIIVDVPDDFKRDFETDIDGAIRDIAGISTVSVSPFIQQRDKIITDKSRLHPYQVQEWDQSKSGDFIWERFAHRVKIRDGAEVFEGWQPLYNPGTTRHIHIDSSLTGDATGFCMGCVLGFKNVERRNFDTGELYSEPAPVIWIDFMLRIVPPMGGEIDFGKVRGLVYQLQAHGFPVGYISMDQWNCLKKGTLINTDKGIIPIEEVSIGDMVQSRVGPRKVENTFSYGMAPTLKLKTRDGDVIEGTGKHRIEVQSGWGSMYQGEYGRTKDPKWEWKRLDDIKIGDVIHICDTPVDLNPKDIELKGIKSEFIRKGGRASGLAKNWKLPNYLTAQFSEFLGLIWGDGYVGSSGIIQLTVHEDDLEDACFIFSNIFGACPKPVVSPLTTKCYAIRFGAIWMVRWLSSNGLVKPNIPDIVMQGSKDVKAAFLRGLFSADGNVSKVDGEITFDTSIETMAHQIRLILRTDFNIESCLGTYEKKYEGQKKLRGWHGGLNYRISVRGAREKFLNNIGFCYSNKQELLKKYRDIKGRRKFTRITSIEESYGEVFDLQVEDDPSYIANGFVSHNSVSSLQKFAVKGIEAERVSVDKPIDAYETLKSTIYEGRLLMYDYQPVLDELRALQHDRIKNKVDHTRHSSKDVSDALAAVTYSLTTKYRGAPLGILKGISQTGNAEADEQREAVEPVDPDFWLMPFLVG